MDKTKSIIEEAKSIVDQYEGLEFKIDKSSIRIDSADPTGFSISLIDGQHESTLFFGNWHHPFEDKEEALSSFEKCLSGDARVRELSSLGITYAGWLEIYDDVSHIRQHQLGHVTIFAPLLWIFPTREKYFRNSFKRLPNHSKARRN